MTRGILIAGNESSLYTAVSQEAAKRVEAFASVLIPNRFHNPNGMPPHEAAGKGIPLSWNPSSPISARTIVLAAENRLGRINDAILICSPPAVYKSAEALLPEEIDILVNDHIRGWFFLIRELTQYFRRSGSGSLAFVVPEFGMDGKNAQADLLGPSATASFRAFVGGILASQSNEPYLAMGFTGPEGVAKGEFAAWLFKIIDEGSRKNSGRWSKFGKMGFFR